MSQSIIFLPWETAHEDIKQSIPFLPFDHHIPAHIIASPDNH